MSTVDKVVKSCAERKAPFQISKKAVNEIEQIAKDAKYTSPFAEGGEKVAEGLKDTVHPDVTAYQAHYAPYINKPATDTTDEVVKSLTNPRPNA